MSSEKKRSLLALGATTLVAFIATAGVARWLDGRGDQSDLVTRPLVAINQNGDRQFPSLTEPLTSTRLEKLQSETDTTERKLDQQVNNANQAESLVHERQFDADSNESVLPVVSDNRSSPPTLVFTPMPAIPGERIERAIASSSANSIDSQLPQNLPVRSIEPASTPVHSWSKTKAPSFAEVDQAIDDELLSHPSRPPLFEANHQSTGHPQLMPANEPNVFQHAKLGTVLASIDSPPDSVFKTKNTNAFDPSFSAKGSAVGDAELLVDRQVTLASGRQVESKTLELDLNAPVERVGRLPSLVGDSAPSNRKNLATNSATMFPTPADPNPTSKLNTKLNTNLNPDPNATASQDRPHVLLGSENFKLAAEPKLGEHYRDDRPITGPQAHLIESLPDDFSPGPNYDAQPYISDDHRRVYEGKKLYANQRPLVELGRPWYQLGPLSPGYNWFGKHNNIAPQFLIYGDYRSAVASNTANGDNVSMFASELNLDIDLKLTGTERFHAFVSPLDDGLRNTRYLFDENRFQDEFDANIDFGYFEGDLGAMVGGLVDETLPFDMPFAIGVMPLLLQNGVWMEDAFLGFAATIPARNSRLLNISNMDTTFFAGYDKISSPAFAGDDSAARMYGIASFIEAMNGYFEIDYAFFDDRSDANRSYHNFGFGYTRRFGRLLSNSTRIIVNAGQASDSGPNTADGVLLLSENSLITGAPSTVVPYFNFFAGFDRPQSAARAAQAGGVLRNTGILFETDGMTDYPTLDATANDTYGGALGLNLIADDFSQQLVVEMAMLGVMGNDATRNAPGEQIGLGFRYQLPLTNSIIFRADGMYGFLNDQEDVRGLRFELRHKW